MAEQTDVVGPLPVHGFVLAGGQSRRMGRDKALLPFHGRPMVLWVLEALHSFCVDVSIAGNRADLAALAPVVREELHGEGPVAGLAAGLAASRGRWALFCPVDVPLVPPTLLARWAAEVLAREERGVRCSYLRAGGEPQPAFCMLHPEAAAGVAEAVARGERRIRGVLEAAAQAVGPEALWVAEAEVWTASGGEKQRLPLELCFRNVNTPEELARLERDWTERGPERG